MPGEGEQDNKVQGPLKPYFSAGGEKSPASYANTDVAVGTEVGPFKLLGILGEGGYGIVYLGEQERPIRRRVALKIIKPGMDSKQVIARFEAERQALAFLDHPNIAQIHDAGTTPQGRPYFAMELIEGRPITEHCDRERLSLRERLRLFLQVCSAVRHAHQKGILHRDLKPSNVLVATQDGEPLVKVIDFGIAKALAQPLTDRSLHTEQGQFIGTPDYMSPEQAEMDARGVDTRSDVYSLGVILYELLTGVLPFDPDALRNGGPQNVRRTICQQEPKTPSTRLTALGDGIAGIAERRRTDPQTLARSLRRELEWIPLKAMRKDPSRRYQSASELAADIENYLDGDPLSAGPESAIYRIRKLVQKHRVTVAAAVVVATSLLVALIVTARMYAVAEKARRVAETSQAGETTQRKAAVNERNRAVEAEEEANRRLVDLYEEQGRRYVDLGDLDRALVLLAEALKNDGSRLTARLLAEECLRRHPDPNLHDDAGLRPWEDRSSGHDGRFATSPDRKCVAFVDRGSPTVRVFDTETAKMRIEIDAGDVSQMIFVPGNRYLVAKLDDTATHHGISVFDLETGDRMASVERANACIDTLMACPHGTLPPRRNMEKAYENILVCPDGQWIAFLDADYSSDEPESWIVLWDFRSNTLHKSQRFPFGSLMISLHAMPVGEYGHHQVVATDCQLRCHWWGMPRLEYSHGFYFGTLDGIASQNRMILQKPGNVIEIDDRAGNRQLRVIPGVAAYTFAPNAARLVTIPSPERAADGVNGDGTVVADLWDTTQGDHVAQLTGAPLTNWHFTDDGSFLLSEHGNHAVRVWDSKSGRMLFEIPSELNLKIADISPDGNWVLTRYGQTRTDLQIWRLPTGDRFRPYAAGLADRDMAAEWTIGGMDNVFRCSDSSPGMLPRLNSSGSALICHSGLLPFQTGTSRAAAISGLVTRYIPMRIENGRIRDASQEEMWLAWRDYWKQTNAGQGPELADCLLSLASHALERNDLKEAFAFLREYRAIPDVQDETLVGRGAEVSRQLHAACLAGADCEERRGRYGSAIDQFETGIFLDEEDPEAANRLAWILATCPEPELRDVTEALALARRACASTGWSRSDYLHTFAVACAAAGRFEEAVRMQTEAIERLSSAESGRWAENYRVCLHLFESERAYDWRSFRNLPDRNLLGWWKFEGQDGKIIRDLSGRGCDAEIVGDVRCLSAEGGASFVFSNEGFVRCLPMPDLDARSAVSAVAWVRYAPTDNVESWSQKIVEREHVWTLAVRSNTHLAMFECAGLKGPTSSSFSRVYGTTPLDDGRWHLLAGVYDGHVISAYVDGRLEGTMEVSGSLTVLSGHVFLGKGLWPDPWQGALREVRIYHRALRAEELAVLYEETKW